MELKHKNRKHEHSTAEDAHRTKAAEHEKDAPRAEGKGGAASGAESCPAPEQTSAERTQTEPVPQDEIAVLKDRLLRTMADFDNFRKRTARDKAEIHQRANEDLMKELLPILDHLDLAMEATKSGGPAGAHVDGFKLVGEHLVSALKKFGLQTVESVGRKFDPELHEALSLSVSDTVPEDGIIAEIRKGYTLGGKLLRPARVVVSTGPDIERSAEAGIGEVPEATDRN